MENSTVTHISLNSKFRIKIERAASTKGILGYIIEVNSDDMPSALADIAILKANIETMTPAPAQEIK